MAKIEQDQLFFNTNFNEHTKLYEDFKVTVIWPTIVRHGVTLEKWADMLKINDL